MSLEKEIREKLLAEAADYKKLDQLVRQGMLPSSQLPMLHRGLDKMQSGKALNPQEREAVNKVMQSMLYIVTGDSQVFQKAKQHTQKTRYQTEETIVEGEEIYVMKKGSFQRKVDGATADRMKKQGWSMIGKDSREEVEEQNYVGAKGEKGQDYHNAGTFDKKTADIHAKKTKGVAHKDVSGKYVVKHGKNASVVEDSLDEYGMMKASAKDGYKAKFDAMLKKAGKSLKDMSDDEKKEFFNKVDASHKAKDESIEEGYGKKKKAKEEADIKEYITGKQVKMAKGIAFDKRHKGGDMTGAVKKMEKIKKGLSNHPGAQKALKTANEDATHVVKYTDSKGKHVNSSKPMTSDKAKAHAMKAQKVDKVGGKYTVHGVNEDMASDSEEMRAKTQRKLQRLSNMKARQEKETDKGYQAAQKESAAADAKRDARADSRGLAPTKKDSTPAKPAVKKDDHGGHIVMQLRKAVTIDKPVKFKDGSSHNVSKADAHKYMSKYMKAKPADKEKMHSAHDSHDSFQSHLK
jgi:hypothetical protein